VGSCFRSRTGNGGRIASTSLQRTLREGDLSTGPTLPKPLFVPAFWIVSSLALDLMQYVLGAISWGSYARVQELRGVQAEAEFAAPRYVNWGALAAFWLKLLSISIAYWYLLKFASECFG
jgi:hypothetical protein